MLLRLVQKLNAYFPIEVKLFPKVMLSSFAANIPLLPEYIEAKTNIPTVIGNPWQLVQSTPAQQQALMNVASEFAVAIGLAERSNE